MAEDRLFELPGNMVFVLQKLLPELSEVFREATAQWEELPADDLEWYGSERAMATHVWLGKLGYLVWALREFCEENEGG